VQFDPKGLARLIANVERDVLVEAVEIAGMTSYFTTPSRETIEELQGLFNVVTNLSLFRKPLSKWNLKALEALRSNKPVTTAGAAYAEQALEIIIFQKKLDNFIDKSDWDRLFALTDLIQEFL